MRLDHLLSKEHLDLFGGCRNPDWDECSWLGLVGGTFDMASARLASTSTPGLFGGRVGGWGPVSGASARCWVLRDRTLLTLLWCGWVCYSLGLDSAAGCVLVGGVGCRPYFENYTVDASIFETVFGSSCNR